MSRVTGRRARTGAIENAPVVQINAKALLAILLGALFGALVGGKWNVPLKVHSVVEDAHDIDRASWGDAVHQEVPSTPTVSRNVQRAKTRHDLVSGFGAHNIGTAGEFANRPKELSR